MRPACPVFISGLAAGDQFLLLLFSQLQRLGGGFLGIPGWRTIGFSGEKTQDRFNELIVSGYRHGRFLVKTAFFADRWSSIDEWPFRYAASGVIALTERRHCVTGDLLT
ncbi:hypothetical protein D3C81_1873430 [compost metagenome]